MNDTQLATKPSPPPNLTPVAMGERGIQCSTFDELARFCLAICKSRLAPKGFETPEAIMVAIQHGAEIGLGPMQALQSIAIINGRPSLYGDAALGLVKSHPDCLDVVETFDEAKNTARCEVRRRNQIPVVREFSEADAKKAGLWAKAGPWTQYTRRMLQMRARSFALRDSFPDCLKGIAIREESQDLPQPAQARVVEPPRLKFADEPAVGADPAPVENVALVDNEKRIEDEDFFK